MAGSACRHRWDVLWWAPNQRSTLPLPADSLAPTVLYKSIFLLVPPPALPPLQHPSDFTNDPSVIARHDRMAAINAALAVDLTGQVAADTLGGKPYSGIGGQASWRRVGRAAVGDLGQG